MICFFLASVYYINKYNKHYYDIFYILCYYIYIMGRWGYYDDECDYVIDQWWEILNKVVPKSLNIY